MKKRLCSTKEIIGALTQVELGLPLTDLIRQLARYKTDITIRLCPLRSDETLRTAE